MGEMSGRLRANPLVIDGLLAVGLSALSLVTVAAGARDVGALHPGSIALLLLQTVPLVVRRVAPIPVFLLTGTATIVHGVLATGSLNTTLGSLISLYTVAERYDRRTSGVAALALGGAMAALIVSRAPMPAALGGFIQTMLACLVAWLMGTWARERHAYIGVVETRAVRAEQEREAEARRAVADERDRIARELHDVVAHHVSVIVIQAGAARRAIARRPEDASAAIAAIDDAGRQALTDMRRIVGIFGGDASDPESREPMPGLDRLGALIESVRAAGLPVELSINGDRAALDAGIELSAYRIVQEALTNTLKHAEGARARVSVRFEPSAVDISVTDEGGAGSRNLVERSGDGRGLIGMRERVAMFGGEFDAGQHGSGFRVHARLPLADAGGRS